MVLGRAQPDIHLFIGIQIHVGQSQHRRFVVKSLRDTFDQGREVECDQVHLHANLPQVLLNQNRHPFPILVPRIGDDREHHRISFAIFQRPVFEPESLSLQEFQSCIRTVGLRMQLAVEPEFVGG